MPVNLYPNATEAELLALAESLQRRLTVGEVQFVTVAGGGQMSRGYQNTRQAKTELMAVLYALFKKNPATYENPYAQRIRVTRPSYNPSGGQQFPTIV